MLNVSIFKVDTIKWFVLSKSPRLKELTKGCQVSFRHNEEKMKVTMIDKTRGVGDDGNKLYLLDTEKGDFTKQSTFEMIGHEIQMQDVVIAISALLDKKLRLSYSKGILRIERGIFKSPLELNLHWSLEQQPPKTITALYDLISQHASAPSDISYDTITR